ncbi:unnamed protein product [Owenia fusiformis]|uniref:N-acetylglucosamine-1-phosphotransferase subunits alpha/beta n=1 Tax=Owenia fusiformis TaxID=6347 RepID=A0A8S4P4D3_OWEFU|nr:unnamed protein product [Owenia fusiformis]
MIIFYELFQDIFPNASHLPTFSSPAIESHLHRIPGLSDKFIYMNDDVMFGKEVWPDDFYTHAHGQKVYLTWPVPNCQEGCPGSWIKDGYCDKACNNTECDWDGGDCTGDNVRHSFGGDFGGGNWGHQSNDKMYCNAGCANNWIADRYCDQSCNVKECGFDAGDCGDANFHKMYRVDVNPNLENYTLPQGTLVSYFNLSAVFGANGTIEEGKYDESEAIRSGTMSQKFKTLHVILYEKHNNTNLHFTLKGSSGTEKVWLSFNVTVNTNPVPHKDGASEGEVIIESKVLNKTSNVTHVVSKVSNRTKALPFVFTDVPQDIRSPRVAVRDIDPKRYQVYNTSDLKLPENVKELLEQLEADFKQGDLTEKGYNLEKADILDKHQEDIKLFQHQQQQAMRKHKDENIEENKLKFNGDHLNVHEQGNANVVNMENAQVDVKAENVDTVNKKIQDAPIEKLPNLQNEKLQNFPDKKVDTVENREEEGGHAFAPEDSELKANAQENNNGGDNLKETDQQQVVGNVQQENQQRFQQVNQQPIQQQNNKQLQQNNELLQNNQQNQQQLLQNNQEPLQQNQQLLQNNQEPLQQNQQLLQNNQEPLQQNQQLLQNNQEPLQQNQQLLQNNQEPLQQNQQLLQNNQEPLQQNQQLLQNNQEPLQQNQQLLQNNQEPLQQNNQQLLQQNQVQQQNLVDNQQIQHKNEEQIHQVNQQNIKINEDTLNQEKPAKPKDPLVEQNKDSLVGEQKEGEVHKSRILNSVGFLPWEKQGVFADLQEKKESMARQRAFESEPVHGRHLLDTFGDSLRHVNKLYNQMFGYDARKVPGHMPHMIDKNIMNEMQNLFPHEWDVTSSHKIRHSKDMQFAFSFFYYVIGAKQDVTVEMIFDEMDVDKSGVLSDRELRTLATRLYELPLTLEQLTGIEKNLINCSQHTKQVEYVSYNNMERYYEKDMRQVTKTLVLNCEPIIELLSKNFKVRNKFKFEILGDDDIAFKMIRSNVSRVVGQLDDIRRNPKKFVCLNDNIQHGSEESKTVKAVLQDFYEGLFPLVSQFELPREYRNRFLHTDELRAWRRYRDWLKMWTHLALFILIMFTIASFFGDKIEQLKRKFWRQRVGERKKDRVEDV